MKADNLLLNACILTLKKFYFLKQVGPESSETGDSMKIGILWSPVPENITQNASEAI